MRTIGRSGIEGGRDILVLRSGTDDEASPLLASEFDEWSPVLSGDGRWIAYESTESGQFEVFVRPFPEVEAGRIQG